MQDRKGSVGGDPEYGPAAVAVAPVGSVYELTPPAQAGNPWTEAVLYNFQNVDEGYVAYGDLTFDKAGNLHGVTLFGGGKGTTCDSLYGGQCGTVFKLNRPKMKGGEWTETVLHRFAGPAQGVAYGDGALPNGGLMLDSAGNVYETTLNGGNNVKGRCASGDEGTGCGTVFELVPPTQENGQWTEKVLHLFMNGADGTNPTAGVVLGANGFLYGAANGGPNLSGVVFKLVDGTGGKWQETILYAAGNGFEYYFAPAVSGLDAGGSLYGTTNVGPPDALARW